MKVSEIGQRYHLKKYFFVPPKQFQFCGIHPFLQYTMDIKKKCIYNMNSAKYLPF